MRHLQIGPDVRLPADAVTQTFAILAKRGVGKTYTALVLVEELLGASAQVVIADPVGVCWGLRAAANGRDPGLPIIVMGGDHGDVPLEASAGKVVAEFVVDTRSSVVLDLALLRKGDQVRFMTDFAETLYHRNRAPLHLVLDEADAFAPQRPLPDQARMLGAIQDLVRRGRARGIGVTLVTQRAAVLSKDVLTQVEVLVALRTIAPQDRGAIDAWIQAHDAHGQREEFMASLASLPIGTAWFWSPGWLDIFRRVKVRARRTFDSSATPAVGARAAAPKRLAPVDLEALKGRIAATIERAKAEDPKALRARIAQLEAETRKLAASAPAPKRVEVPVLKPELVKRLEVAMGQLVKLRERAADGVVATIGGLIELVQRVEGADAKVVSVVRELQATLGAKPTPTVPALPPPPRSPAPPPARSVVPGPAAAGLTGPQQRILDTLRDLVVRDLAPDRERVARWQGIHPNGGRYNRDLGLLRAEGYLEGFQLTDKGYAAARAQASGLEAALRALPDDATRRVLQAVVDAKGRPLSREELAHELGIHPNGGRYNRALGWLRTMGVITERGPIAATEGLHR